MSSSQHANPLNLRFSAGGHSFMDFDGRDRMGGWIIPQDIYHQPQNYNPLPTVRFTINGRLGIKLADAVDPKFRELDNPQLVPRLTETAGRITIRIQWPGYDLWSDVLHIYDHGYDVNPHNMQKLAKLIAQKVRVFLDDFRAEPSTHTNDDSWWLEKYPFDRLVLLELRHVSLGSWQPVLMALP
ncbi:hypothetical protein BC835DRAFT_1411758 [Cytidiella melzeri]|nr:hypothetical protein BC835DRAFT_1411758 [Cytidiella melzeri]